MELLLKAFPVIVEIPVAWGEMDALGHVNNVVYFRLPEELRRFISDLENSVKESG